MTAFRLLAAGFCLATLIVVAGVAHGDDIDLAVETGEEFQRQAADAMDLLAEDKYAEAEALLDSIGNDKDLNKYERASLWLIYGNLYFDQENWRAAEKAYKKALKPKNLPKNFQAMGMAFLGKTYKAQNQEKKYIQAYRKAAALHDPPQPSIVAELGEIEFQANQYMAAADHFGKAIKLASKKGPPRESWLIRYGYVSMKLGRVNDYIDSVRQLALLYPDEETIGMLKKLTDDREPLLTEPDLKKRKKSPPELRDEILLALSSAIRAIEIKGYDTARVSLEKLLMDQSLNPYERGSAWHLMAKLYNAQENIMLAIYAKEQARRLGNIPDILFKSTYTDLSILYGLTAQHELAIARANQLREAGFELESLAAACLVYGFSKQRKEAIETCERYIAVADKQSIPVTRAGLRSLMVSYFKTGDEKNYQRIKERLAAADPNTGDDEPAAGDETAGEK